MEMSPVWPESVARESPLPGSPGVVGSRSGPGSSLGVAVSETGGAVVFRLPWLFHGVMP